LEVGSALETNLKGTAEQIAVGPRERLDGLEIAGIPV
jgi:hypothetical protein